MMHFLLSPAKSLNESDQPPFTALKSPQFREKTLQLVELLKDYSEEDLSRLMKISPKLAKLNRERYAQFEADFTPLNSRPALYLFKGDVYSGLDAYTLKEVEVNYLERSLTILSGLYGMIEPLDLIQPYRLEMGTKLPNPLGENLYQFWGDQLSIALNEKMKKLGQRELINLASNEYFKALNPKKIEAPIITPIFKDYKNGAYKIISFYAKKARGLMMRFAAEKQLTSAEELKSFSIDGYQYQENDNPNELLFLRKEEA